MKNVLLAFLFILSGSVFGALPTPDADDGGIELPPGFRAVVVADNLVSKFKSGALRFLSIAPNGDIYAKFMRDGLVVLRDTNADGRADVMQKFGSGNGTCVLVRGEWLYYSTTTAVYRYPYKAGELVPQGEPQVIVTNLPAGRQHDAKVFAFDGEGKMLVEVGSPFNVYSKGDRQAGAKGYSPEEVAKFQETYGGFWRFDPDKLNQTPAEGEHFSTGHRHCLSLVWNPVSQNFFMCMMGRDNLDIVDPADYDALDNAERVSEEFHRLKKDLNIGWPYSYWDPIKKARMMCPEFGGDNKKREENPAYDKPLIGFPGHWAPLQMTLYTGTQFPKKYQGGMFLAFHGSWNRAPRPQAGYKVVFIPFDEQGMPKGTYDEFATGFPGVEYFTSTRDAKYRPCGVAVGPDGSLYIGETEKGRIWRVIYTGESGETAEVKKSVVATAVGQTYPAIGVDSAGGKIYAQVCAACHMPNGAGVPTMQPALAGNAIIGGDPNVLINILLKGPPAVLPANREKFAGAMPPFSIYKDEEIASVLNYLRANFAKEASTITAQQVAVQRAKMK